MSGRRHPRGSNLGKALLTDLRGNFLELDRKDLGIIPSSPRFSGAARAASSHLLFRRPLSGWGIEPCGTSTQDAGSLKGEHTEQVGRDPEVLHRILPSQSTKRAILTSGGVTWCGHKLIAGEAHLRGCKVGTELLWLHLDSKVVLIDCFLGERGGGHFCLPPLPLANYDILFPPCLESLSWVWWDKPVIPGT